MNALKKAVIRGAFWTVAGYGASQLLRFGGNLLLTRLLFPEFFGLMALVNIFIIGLNLFSDVGIGLSIIQNQRGDEPRFLNTAWTMKIIRGFGIWLACLWLATPVANLYQEPQLQWLIPIVGLTSILDGFSSTNLYTLERHMALKKLTILELTAQVIQLTVMIVWALFSPTLWAMVAGGITYTTVKLIASYWVIPGQGNRLQWDSSAAREIFNLGRWIFISTALTFLAEQADRLLLGKLFSLELLGVYGIALMFSDVPRQVTGALSIRVVLPAASKLTELPRPELRAKILPYRKRLLLIMIAGMALLISGGDLLILTLYDERYADAAWMLPILALGIWPRLLCSTIDSALIAFGQVQYTAIGNFFRLLSTVGGILLGYNLAGPIGAVVAVALNDVMYYICVNFGLHREGMSCLKQDLKATALLLGGVVTIWMGRLALGIGFASWKTLLSALPTS